MEMENIKVKMLIFFFFFFTFNLVKNCILGNEFKIFPKIIIEVIIIIMPKKYNNEYFAIF